MHLWLIPALPLLGFLINGIFGRRLLEGRRQRGRHRHRAAVVRVGAEDRCSALGALEAAHTSSTTSPGFQSGTLNIGFDFAVDRLTAVMLLVVTGIGSLIHIYADRLHGA